MRKESKEAGHASMLLVCPVLFPFFFFFFPFLLFLLLVLSIVPRAEIDGSRAFMSHSSAYSRLSPKIRVRILGKLNFNSTRSVSRWRETFARICTQFIRVTTKVSPLEFGSFRSRSGEIQSAVLILE